ncbi:hypothetical protein DSM104440_01878 [Usitatibacter palustris]|uniref:Uncharacterized protein n=2 Tax=Usitatibacter palustris TaxID=2732487 RepID=A0A6M4H6S0_9PROT|nr:hypothetical protein DSM104440_01878 [Usitatibacter palustris]
MNVFMKAQLPIVSMALLLGAALLTLSPIADAQDKKKDAERAERNKMANDTLQRLYKTEPKAKAAIEKAAGYAVFSNFGMKILVAGGGSGQGLAKDKAGKVTYMKMLEMQAGLGFGVKKFRLVWVFDTPDAYNKFVNSGWELGSQATVSAKKGDQGAGAAGAMPVSPGIWLYQLTDDGLALELTAKGTKYSKDEALN